MGGKEEHVSCGAHISSFFAMYIFLYPLISWPCILLYPYLNPLISWPCIFLYPGHLHPMIQLYGPHTMHAHGTWYNPIKLSNFLRLVWGIFLSMHTLVIIIYEACCCWVHFSFLSFLTYLQTMKEVPCTLVDKQSHFHSGGYGGGWREGVEGGYQRGGCL